MKDVNIVSEIVSNINKPGYLDLSKMQTQIKVGKEIYTYLASGLAKHVFRSVCGKWVIKLPKTDYQHHKEHLMLEVECYNEAPEWCKNNIAKTFKLSDTMIIQEYVEVQHIGGWWGEIGIRENKDVVIFDCDPFLEMSKKPKDGFKYNFVFSLTDWFGEDVRKHAVEEPKRLRHKKRLEIERLYGKPNTWKSFKESDVFSKSGRVRTILINDIEIPEEHHYLFD